MQVERLEERSLLSALSISDAAVVEGNAGETNAVFTITLSAPDTQTVTVTAVTTDNTAISPVDYTPLATVVTFNPGETTKTVTVAVNGDTLVEANETFFVSLNAAVNATFGDNVGVGTIINDDATPILPPPTVSINDVTVVEGNGGADATSAVFTITLSAASALPVTVTATPANNGAGAGFATSGVDYNPVAVPTPVVFAPGETSKTVTVLINGDGVLEPTETFAVNLVAINAIPGDAQGLGTILDDDTAPPPVFPLPTLSINDVAVLEGNPGDPGTTNAVFTVTLSAASPRTVNVTATTTSVGAPNPATDGVDYTPVAVLVTFLPGETSKTVTVPISRDLLDETNETFFVDLTVATNATFADAQGLGTIVDDDPAGVPPVVPLPNLSINDVTVVEGNAGTTSAVFTITLSAASSVPVTVVATPADGTATSPDDYIAVAVPTIVTFAPGETTKTVTVAINGDVVAESDETFVVDLTVPLNATLADAQGLGTILDDDTAGPPVVLPPSISISDVSVLEGTTGATTNAVFTVTLSAASPLPVSVTATTSDGTATVADLDYLLSVANLTFLPGETSKTVTVVVNGDTAVEANETFFVNLTSPVNGTLADSTGQGTIINDDSTPVPPPPTLSINDVTVVEGNAGATSAVFTVTLSAASATPVTVTATTADGTATVAGLDYVLTTTPLVFAPGETSKTVIVPVNGDTTVEPNENFFVNLTLPVGATLADSQGLGTILTDDPTPPVLPPPSASISDAAVLEGGTSTTSNLVFTVTLSAASAVPVTVLATSADGTATVSGADYVLLPPTLVTFLPGETSKTVNVVVNGDAAVEPNETLFVNLTAPVNVTLADSQGLGTIVNDDGPTPPVFPLPTLSINDVSVVEGNVGTTSAVFTVTLSAPSLVPVTVVATTADGTATATSDYAPPVATVLTFAPGETTKTVTVTINSDTLNEPNETFTVNLSAPVNATLADAQGLGTILNDDAAPSVTLEVVPSSIVEGGGAASVIATLSAPSGQNVTVNLTFSGTAADGTDYTHPSASIVIPAGSTTGTLTLTAVADTLDEADETIVVDISSVTNGTELGVQQGTTTILDDDPTTATVTLSVLPATIGEAGGSATVTATLSAPSGQNVTVNLAFSGTATDGTDYTHPSASIVIPAGSTTGTLTLTAVGDTLDEANETIVVDISSVTNATELGVQQGTTTILDDDPTTATVTLSVLPATIAEASGTATVTATLSAPSGQDVTVNLAFSGTASDGVDYTHAGTSIVIPAGSTTGTLTLTAVSDTSDEANETIVVDISSVINATESGTQTGTTTIVDDDPTPPTVTLTVTPATVSEGAGPITVTATLSAISTQDVTVNLAFSGTATDGTDYTHPGTTIVIAAGTLSNTLTLTVVNDTLDEPSETVVVDISSVTNGTEAGIQQGTSTITDNDPTPTLSIDDVEVEEGDDGLVNAVFTVTLSAASGQPVTVIASSADGSATSPSDYFALPPTTLTFAPGETSKTVTVLVRGDTVTEPDETFFVTISGATNATIADPQGVGTITNDDIFVPIPGFIGLVPDPENPGQQMLLVVGTIGNDRIDILHRLFGNVIVVKMNHMTVAAFDHDDPKRVVVYGLEGHDRITVDYHLGKYSELHGNEGNDTMYGGRGNDELFGDEGNDRLYGRLGRDRLHGGEGDDRLDGSYGDDILLGDEGNDTLYGGASRDILIGGTGRDKLYGGSGDDILIGGETAYDDDEAALNAILAEWISGNSYADRVANIRDGSGDQPGQNDGNFLDEGTVLDDDDVDDLFGQSDQDWFFNFDDGNDKLRDRSSRRGEAVN